MSDIALMYVRLGQSLEESAGRYELPLAAVYATMAYYDDHQAEIDRSIEDELAFAEALRAGNVSPVQRKPGALVRG